VDADRYWPPYTALVIQCAVHLFDDPNLEVHDIKNDLNREMRRKKYRRQGPEKIFGRGGLIPVAAAGFYQPLVRPP